MNKGAIVRDEVIFKTLYEELVGPCLYGEEIDVSEIAKVPYEKFNNAFVGKETGQEILKIHPLKRYGVGVLFPEGITQSEVIDESVDDISDYESESDEIENEVNDLKYKSNKKDTSDSDDFDISLTNARAPSSVGLSFLLDPELTSNITIEVTGAFYKRFTVETCNEQNHTFKRDWWHRKPIKVIFTKALSELDASFKLNLYNEISLEPENLLSEFYIEGVVRNFNNKRLITVALVNRNKEDRFIERNMLSLFQTQLIIRTDLQKSPAILPYPEPNTDNLDDQSNQLLYRNAQVFGKGHGAACNWKQPSYTKCDAVNQVFTEVLPTFETPSISAEVDIDMEKKLVISMKELSDFETGSKGDQQIKSLFSAYDTWIDKQEKLIEKITKNNLQKTAIRHIDKCRNVLIRVKDGYRKICDDELVRYAFKLANEAMLNQQKHAPKNIRKVSFDNNGHPIVESKFVGNNAKGIWRPFQIGFLLMCINGVIDNTHEDREVVDLIWFPTGGGKTEAYLGLAAFMMIFERLKRTDSSDGVQVLMRYTLRLLTAQQLQRAATLICCLEAIRQKEDLPGKRFSIGLWVGSKNTPNKRKSALYSLQELKKQVKEKKQTTNPFLLDRCPYCATALGIITIQDNQKRVLGYKKNRETESVIFSCVDTDCLFHKQIPVFVIDEDIYEERPSIVIGTVDKFALLTWEPKIRRLFGIGDDGLRFASPPQLIIQDELHLITGPLGSMVALYEPLIEKLCSETHGNKSVMPKIVCATATTKGYQEQIKTIFGREVVNIFPALGIDAEDSFFAKYNRDSTGKLSPGRKYVGVCAPGLGSVLTTQVRAQSALLLAANRVEIENRDPWVTLLSFYNSIRELGGALTLFQSDIVGYLLEQKRRYPKWILPRRNLNGIELTSRLKDDEIPKAIVDLEKAIDLTGMNVNFYENIVNELSTLEKKYPEILSESIQIKTSINTHGFLQLEDYHSMEKIYLYLRKQEPRVNLPTRCKKLFNICTNYTNVQAYCLASSIIEVGVDIDRLSVMSIIGQPKTTAQYIQVSGRIGRNDTERPGLVVTIYNNAKPRDKSHYEDFRGYHQRLYARVEPATVTPFSRPALRRGLAAITIANLRQHTPINSEPNTIPASLINEWNNELLKLRSIAISEDELIDITNFFKKFISTWDRRTATFNTWGKLQPNKEPAQTDLLYPLGNNSGNIRNKIACPTSMRNVDGESAMWITDAYEDYNDFGDWDV